MLKNSIKNKLEASIDKIKCHHAKMICISLACLLNTGCGKKVQNSSTNDDVQRRTLGSNIFNLKATLENSGYSIPGNFRFDNNGLVRIPEQLKVLKGNAGNRLARIYFNVREGLHEFYCNYKGGASGPTPNDPKEIKKGLSYNLLNCFQDVNNDGIPEELNYYAGFEAPQDMDNFVRLEVLSSDPRYTTEIQAQFEVEWH
jgi:hypothetical protein